MSVVAWTKSEERERRSAISQKPLFQKPLQGNRYGAVDAVCTVGDAENAHIGTGLVFTR